MPLLIGVPAESIPGERRLSVVPDVVKKYLGLGAQMMMQAGAGQPAHLRDEMFADVKFVPNAAEISCAPPLVLQPCGGRKLNGTRTQLVAPVGQRSAPMFAARMSALLVLL